MSWFPALVCLYLYVFSVAGSEIQEELLSPPYIPTENGVVKGKLVKSVDFSYMAYLGIPYAAPPVGENRFKSPLPAMPWNGVYEASRTVQCPQSGYGEEDCLVINIFTPIPINRQHHRRPLPILVFIHGGAFIRGTAPTTGMEYLLKHDIAVVTFNYRLGALGFLCLGTEDAPGNAGLKDQVAALQWIQRNIINFGGHPRHVVIYGTDAGAVSVDLLIMSKMSAGLFKGAILESGSATSPWSVDVDPIGTATKLAETLNFIPKDIEDLALFYKNKIVDDLTTVNELYYNSLNDGTVGFSPCIETSGAKPHIRQFLQESPYDMLMNGKYDEVPVLVIFSSLEGLFLKNAQYYEQIFKERMENEFEYFLPGNLAFETEEDKRILAEAIKIFYYGNRTISKETLVENLEYFGDSLVLNGILKSVEYHCKRMPVYLMEFFYKGNLKTYEPLYENITVAGHSAASEHAFVSSLITNLEDMRAVETFAELITNFVKHDNPTPRLTCLLPTAWPRVNSPNKMQYMRFDGNLMMAIRPHWRRKQFWDNVFKLYRSQLNPVEPC
ncbi:esterase FE4-like [Cydia pomonella]|uniref:esterase FE4-like n=1 Tax=Cydia pomonella TaxID=82600 RepID=UPI002ADDF0C7|nr:esterase FE4-like [Cydia pomonella]